MASKLYELLEWARENGEVLIYYASSDTRMHVATSRLDKRFSDNIRPHRKYRPDRQHGQ